MSTTRNPQLDGRLTLDMQTTADALSGTVYIPDTSALIENPDALDRLLTGGNVVVLLHQVLEELGAGQRRGDARDEEAGRSSIGPILHAGNIPRAASVSPGRR